MKTVRSFTSTESQWDSDQRSKEMHFYLQKDSYMEGEDNPSETQENIKVSGESTKRDNAL